jgi:hypothetical protein
VANYQAVARLRPEVRDFIRNRRWVHRGDVVTYAPNISCESFSTDGLGFRHSTYQGKKIALADCIGAGRYGVVLGPSNVYGFGLAGNENTIPSVLAGHFGFPFANLGLPEGNSRNLFSILLALVARADRAPAVVLHLPGGDFTSFCYTSIADPVFGSPNLKQIALVRDERGGVAPPQPEIGALLAFSSLWIGAIGELCRARNVSMVLGEDVTFFEKAEPSETDRLCELGEPFGPGQAHQFARHRKFVRACYARRSEVAEQLSVPLCGPGAGHDVGFIDEFHYDRDGTRLLCDHFAQGIADVL